ncbi:hypothetical protein BGX29_008607 [Mortierella sp. GBA35]|nr:hypothetical protein BGX29_008607 [Mortierella sp. GBA35]
MPVRTTDCSPFLTGRNFHIGMQERTLSLQEMMDRRLQSKGAEHVGRELKLSPGGIINGDSTRLTAAATVDNNSRQESDTFWIWGSLSLPAISTSGRQLVTLRVASFTPGYQLKAAIGEEKINFVLLVSRQGKTRLAKWFTTMSPKEKTKIVKDVTQLVLSRRTKMCNFLEYKDTKVIYRRYASLFFITGIDPNDNELLTLEIIHRYVEVLDRYFGNVCELDLIFNFHRAYFILDELLIAGEMQESSKKTVLRVITSMDAMEEEEAKEEAKK